MKMQASRLLSISPELTWQALNDPEILKQCIPGCQRFEADPDKENTYLVTSQVKIGPVNAKFNGQIEITDIVPPRAYTLNFDAQGGVAGYGKGSAKVTLNDHPQGVDLHYEVESEVGGKIAQLGQRLIDGAAKSMADDFFKRFETALMADPDQPEQAKTATTATDTTPSGRSGVPIWFWLIILAAIVVAVVIAG